MKRWIIETDIGTMRLYYKTYELAKEAYPDTKITEDTDKTYLEYIDKILSKATDKPLYYRGYKKIYKIPTSAGHIWYHQGEDKEDGFLYDYCEYQVIDDNSFIPPIGFTMSNPKEFYDLFLKDETEITEYKLERFSLLELNKIKPKPIKICSKGHSIWIDDQGYIYEADTTEIRWAKGEKALYEKFNPIPNCVYVKYGENSESWSWKGEWFVSLEDFLETHKELIEKTTRYYLKPSYKIIKTGYSRLPPNQRKNIIKYPYINFDSMLKMDYNTMQIATNIYKKVKHLRFFKNCLPNWFEENIVKTVVDYKKHLTNE